MWERHIDDDKDVELMLEQGARPESALLAADGAQPDAPSSDPEHAPTAEQAAPPRTTRLSCGARCQMPSRGRLALMNRYLDLMFITATMAIMETGDKVMLAGAAVSFALIACLNLHAWFPDWRGSVLIGLFLVIALLLGCRLFKSVTEIEEMEVHAEKFAVADADVERVLHHGHVRLRTRREHGASRRVHAPAIARKQGREPRCRL